MNVIEQNPDSITIRFSKDELGLTGNALNEVCHGVDIAESEFQTRLGNTREDCKALLAQIVSAYRAAFDPEQSALDKNRAH